MGDPFDSGAATASPGVIGNSKIRIDGGQRDIGPNQRDAGRKDALRKAVEEIPNARPREPLFEDPRGDLGMVVGRGSIPLLAGIALGSAGAAALAIVTSQALPEIDVRDPMAYAMVTLPLVALALAATCIPARRATQVDPLLALRAE